MQSLGPNCVISLSSPQAAVKAKENSYIIENEYNNCESLCPCCDSNVITSSDSNCKSSVCHHNSRSSSSRTYDHYDSDFDTEQCDSIVEHDVSDDNLDEGQQEMANNEIDNNDDECKYEVICQNDISLTCGSLENINQCVHSKHVRKQFLDKTLHDDNQLTNYSANNMCEELYC